MRDYLYVVYEQLDTAIHHWCSPNHSLLIAHFVAHRHEYITVDKLSEKLFCSRNTLTASLKKVESIFKEYAIKFAKRPKYEMKIVGKEFDIRSCNKDNLLKDNHFY